MLVAVAAAAAAVGVTMGDVVDNPGVSDSSQRSARSHT
jgi:hypothetical protein